MKLSVLEQSSLSEGSSAAEAISNTVALSKELDRLGYSRIWVSEHHNLNILQGSIPEVLLAAIGAQTTRIRLGSGGVILPNHSAYHIMSLLRSFCSFLNC
jgi:alkanesulfonate monooxygenase SsuD/methylene tetrahydromethanopterin reductase-like flavin-dependent oxidoreductase (luciferase family)